MVRSVKSNPAFSLSVADEKTLSIKLRNAAIQKEIQYLFYNDSLLSV
jgi:hypothetical protein